MREIQFRTFGQTDISTLSLAVIVASGILIFILPKRYVLPVMLFPLFFISEWQRVVVSGLDFNVIRIMVLFGWARLFVRGQLQRLKLNRLDLTIIFWVLSGMLFYTLQRGTTSALIQQLGNTMTILGSYFLFRCLVTNWQDVNIIFKALVIICVGIASVMIVETISLENPLAAFGARATPSIREGRVRAQAAFGHAILAGTLGGALLPVFFSLWWHTTRIRVFAVIGSIAALVIVFSSQSSGPLLTMAAGLVAMAFWPLRKYMKVIRLAAVYGLVALHFVMKASVWFIIARAGLIGGSTAYHRALLLERAISHFNEWWLLGTESTAHWGWGLQDITNQYVRTAVNGGLITLTLFVVLIILSFGSIGRILPLLEKHGRTNIHVVWALGASLFAHVVSFMGVAYWDQIIILWVLHLSIIAILKDRCDTVCDRIPAMSIRRTGALPLQVCTQPVNRFPRLVSSTVCQG